MATVNVRRKPTYAELEAKVKELQDALFIAERNKALREAGWDILHKRIAELERENRGLQMKLDGEDYFGAELKRQNEELKIANKVLQTRNQEADRLIAELNDQVTADEEEIAGLKADKEILQGLRQEQGQQYDDLMEKFNEVFESRADIYVKAQYEEERANAAEEKLAKVRQAVMEVM